MWPLRGFWIIEKLSRCLVYLGLIWYLKLVYPIPVWGYDENQFLRIAILRFCHGNFCWTTPSGGLSFFSQPRCSALCQILVSGGTLLEIGHPFDVPGGREI